MKNRFTYAKISIYLDALSLITAVLFIIVRFIQREPLNCRGISYCTDLRSLFDIAVVSGILVFVGIVGLVMAIIARKRKETLSQKAIYFSVTLIIIPLLFWALASHR